MVCWAKTTTISTFPGPGTCSTTGQGDKLLLLLLSPLSVIFYSVSLCNRAIRDLWFLWDSGSVSSAAALPQVGLAASLEQYIFISYLCILPVPLRGWQVCPCWGLSAPSRSLWKCPWACGCARRWDSLLSQSCRRTVPAAGCWTKTGCSTTGLICRSCQSSRCSRRNPGPPVYLRRKKKQSVCVSDERGEKCANCVRCHAGARLCHISFCVDVRDDFTRENTAQIHF